MTERTSPDDEVQFPCASLADALPHLRRPPGAAAVRFKIQNAADDAAQVAAYVDARLVYDRLDQVCGRALVGALRAAAESARPRRPAATAAAAAVRALPADALRRHPRGRGGGPDPKAAFGSVKRAAVTSGWPGPLRHAAPWLRRVTATASCGATDTGSCSRRADRGVVPREVRALARGARLGSSASRSSTGSTSRLTTRSSQPRRRRRRVGKAAPAEIRAAA